MFLINNAAARALCGLHSGRRPGQRHGTLYLREGESGEWQDWLVAESASQEAQLAENEETDNRRKALAEALTVLNERERRIFEARRLVDEPITLEELADEFGVSRERVRQIEGRAFEKVQKAVKRIVLPASNSVDVAACSNEGSVAFTFATTIYCSRSMRSGVCHE